MAYPREVARWFPEELQRLIGYRWHRPNIGGWEGQDPIEYLRDASSMRTTPGCVAAGDRRGAEDADGVQH